MVKKLYWKYVMNGYNFHGAIDEFVKLVIASGHYYFVWKGKVYQITGDTYYSTGINVEDID
jgi:hypothetical protein